jgi:pyruvate ferredoxin oxidoreductase beta subunit
MTTFRNLKDTPRDEFISGGTTACGGCGGLEVLRLANKVLGEKVIYVNAAGCFTLLALYPFTPFRGSFLYTTMAGAPASAQGVRDALDVLLAKGRVNAEDDLRVIVLAGDGSTSDIALSSTSGTLFRNLDYWYICYDNEAYSNTGVQQSSSSPLNAKTATTPDGVALLDAPHGRKDIFEIWRAHRPPYIATVSAAYPLDLMRKFEEAKEFKGPKMFLASAPCPTGWHFDPAKTHHYSKLEVDCGIFPLKKAIHGEVTHTLVKTRWRPIEDYLREQGRFAHLFEPTRRDEILRAMQAEVDHYWSCAMGPPIRERAGRLMTQGQQSCESLKGDRTSIAKTLMDSLKLRVAPSVKESLVQLEKK